jgi:hypothetical protein
MAQLRSKSYLRENPGAEEKLSGLGFVLDTKVAANDTRFHNVYTALQRYKEIYGDMLVPQPFEVPDKSPDWPDDTWGLRLGARVNAIRSQGTFVKNTPDRKEMLDAIGFVWSPPESERRKRGRKSNAEKEAEAKAALEAGIQISDADESETTGQEEVSELDEFVSSFDFYAMESESSDEESISKTWGFEGGRELQDVVAAAQEEAAQQAAQDDYKPPRTLAESLAEAKQRAIDVGVIESG